MIQHHFSIHRDLDQILIHDCCCATACWLTGPWFCLKAGLIFWTHSCWDWMILQSFCIWMGSLYHSCPCSLIWWIYQLWELATSPSCWNWFPYLRLDWMVFLPVLAEICPFCFLHVLMPAHWFFLKSQHLEMKAYHLLEQELEWISSSRGLPELQHILNLLSFGSSQNMFHGWPDHGFPFVDRLASSGRTSSLTLKPFASVSAAASIWAFAIWIPVPQLLLLLFQQICYYLQLYLLSRFVFAPVSYLTSDHVQATFSFLFKLLPFLFMLLWVVWLFPSSWLSIPPFADQMCPTGSARGLWVWILSSDNGNQSQTQSAPWSRCRVSKLGTSCAKVSDNFQLW